MSRFFLMAPLGALALAGCSEATQETAQDAAAGTVADTERNAEVAGEYLQDKTAEAAGAVSEGAADLEAKLDDGDTQTVEKAIADAERAQDAQADAAEAAAE